MRKATLSALAIGILCSLTVGCTSKGPSDAGKTPGPSVASMPANVGSIGNPRLLTCTMAASNQPLSPQPGDISAGPLSYPDARMTLASAESRPVVEGMTFYKQGTFVRDGSTVTVTIAGQARSFALLQSVGHPSGDLAVTYQSCPSGGASSWIGGFNLKGRTAACVPLDVAIDGENVIRRIVIPAGGGTCPG
jgi:hypothetical protein